MDPQDQANEAGNSRQEETPLSVRGQVATLLLFGVLLLVLWLAPELLGRPLIVGGTVVLVVLFVDRIRSILASHKRANRPPES
jgi:hypothetical protein